MWRSKQAKHVSGRTLNKSTYVSLVRLLRRSGARIGVLQLLDRWARRSRSGLWVRSWFAIYDLEDMVRLGVPWWTFAAMDQVDEFLGTKASPRVFEWGSGASTVWLARRSHSVLSMEHDGEWASRMSAHLPSNATIRTVAAVEGRNPAVGSRKSGFECKDFSAYVSAIEEEEGSFDLIVIDGRAREACLAKAVGQLAPGGLIVFDNVDRERYRDSIAAFGERLAVSWTRGRTPSLPYPTRTALIRVAMKPAK